MKKEKKPIQYTMFSVRLPKTLFLKLKKRAAEEKRSVNKTTEIILDKELN
jgi:hypothetical protein